MFGILYLDGVLTFVGVWPVNKTNILGCHRPKSAEEADVMLSPDEQEVLLEIKRARIRAGDCSQPGVVKRGVFGTSQGILINQDEALDMVKTTEAEALQKQKGKTVEEQRKEDEFQAERRLRREERSKFDAWAVTRRMTNYGVLNILPRPIKVRIARTKELSRKRNYVPVPIKN